VNQRVSRFLMAHQHTVGHCMMKNDSEDDEINENELWSAESCPSSQCIQTGWSVTEHTGASVSWRARWSDARGLWLDIEHWTQKISRCAAGLEQPHL